MAKRKQVYLVCAFLGSIALFLLTFLIIPEVLLLRLVNQISQEVKVGEVQSLFKGLKHRKKKIVRTCLDLVKTCKPNENSFSLVCNSLKEDHPAARLGAIQLLGKYGPQGEKGVPLLIQDYFSLDRNFQYIILLTLEQIAQGAHQAVPLVTEVLVDKDVRYRKKAAEILIAIGPKAGDALPQLLLSHESFKKDRYIFEKALKHVGPASEECVPDFLGILKEFGKDEKVLKRVLKQLSRMGPAGKSALETVISYVEEGSVETRCLALEALMNFKVKTPVVQKLVFEQLKARSGDIRKQASLTLREIGSLEQENDLEDLIQREPDPRMKEHLQTTLEILQKK